MGKKWLAMNQTRFKTGDQALIRQINLAVILDQLRESAPLSRAALAEKTGLNKTTVSSLVSELIEQNLVVETGLGSTRIGRPSVQLTLNPKAGFLVSIEVGVNFISVIAADFAPHIIYKLNKSIDPNQDQQEIIEQVLVLLKHVISENQQMYGRLLGVAVGVPGLVDFAKGVVLIAPNLHWSDVQLVEILRENVSAPVLLDNEANLAALGEVHFGAARGYGEVLYISAGMGLGGGIVFNGTVMRGVTGFAGEFGHMTIDAEGALCGCGNRGCWETQASQRALFGVIRTAAASGQKTLLTDLARGNLNNLSMDHVVEAAKAGDELCLQALRRIGSSLGIGIASLTNAFNPELVVVGGPLSLAWEWLEPEIHGEVRRRALGWHQTAARIVPARHGVDACVMGGVAAIYDLILANPGGHRLALAGLPVFMTT